MAKKITTITISPTTDAVSGPATSAGRIAGAGAGTHIALIESADIAAALCLSAYTALRVPL